MSKLFISYRRDDTADACGRLYDKLAPRFGAANVFKDVDSIPLGTDFRQVLRDSVAQCAAMLVVIGRAWLTVTDAGGRRRLENPNDFVRIEVEAALARNIPVIPVLVQGAAMPREDELPASLAPLAYRHGTDVRGDPHFHRDADQLIDRLAPLLQATATLMPAPNSASTAPALPPEQFPARLASLGFTATQRAGVAYILPPLCAVPAGEFLMGSDKQRDSQAFDDELPQQRLTLGAYQIGRYPVTVAEYACAVRARAVREPPQGTWRPITWEEQLKQLDHPVVCVSWQDALAYTRWLAKATGQPWRLPTEAEWEKAARGSDGRIYPWGDTFDKQRCNTSEGGKEGTTSVGSYPSGVSPYEAQEMAGNVWEWTSSAFKPYQYSVSDGRENLDSTENRVLRGGSWGDDATYARAAYRYVNRPGNFGDLIGFRLALSPAGS